MTSQTKTQTRVEVRNYPALQEQAGFAQSAPIKTRLCPPKALRGQGGGQLRIDLPLKSAHGKTVGDFTLQLAAFFALLYRYLDNDELCVLVQETPGASGAQLNPVSVSLAGHATFSALCHEVALRESPDTKANVGDASSVVWFKGVAKERPPLEAADIHVYSDDVDQQSLTFEYGLHWSASEIESLAKRYLRLLTHAYENEDTKLDDLPFLSEADQHKLCRTFNDTDIDWPGFQSLPDTLGAQAVCTPDAIAANDADGSVSYAQLERRVAHIANYLVSHCVGPGDVVAVFVPRSCDLLAAVLGVLRAGGAFFMVDPDLPPQRIAGSLAEAGAKIGLCGPKPPALPLDGPFQWISLGTVPESDGEQACPKISPQNRAYIIFTSGSTGSPKPVTVSHGALHNRIAWLVRVYALSKADVSLQRSALSFDPSICEMLRLLPLGGRVYFMPPEKEADIRAVVDAIEREGVTITDLVPGPLAAVLDFAEAGSGLDQLRSLRWVLAGAETMPATLAHRFNRALHAPFGARLINTWGATETTVDATWFDCSAHVSDDPVPIGRPIANTRAYVLGRSGNLIPPGWPGRLCIAGACLSDGYLGVPATSDARFGSAQMIGEVRIYRSGDWACHLPDGSLEFLGRGDRQLNIRGVRIDPREMEALLCAAPGVTEAILCSDATDTAGSAQLFAYVCVPELATGPNAVALRARLAKHVQQANLPDRIVTLSQFPRTAHDKIDVAALAAFTDQSEGEGPRRAPVDAIDHFVLSSVEALLNHSGLSMDDDFFAMGGQSLAALRLTARLQARFGGRICVRDIFEQRTLDAIAASVRVRETNAGPTMPLIQRIPDQEAYPASHAHRRFWTLSRSEPQSTAYTVPFAMRISGRLDPEILGRAVDHLVARHEILRTRFYMHDSVLWQEVLAPDAAKVTVSIPDGRQMGWTQASAQMTKERDRLFDLESGSLFRLGLIPVEDGGSLFYLFIHHMITDAWSLGLMLQSLFAEYRAIASDTAGSLPDLVIQHRDYTHWHNAQWQGAGGGALRRHWLDYLQGAKTLDLVSDTAAPHDGPAPAARLDFEISRDLTAASLGLGRSMDASLFMVLFAAVAIVLHQRSGQRDLVMGTPVAGRPNVALEEQLGCFVNPVALRLALKPGSFGELIAAARTSCLSVFDAQEYPFDLVVQHCAQARHQQKSPIFNAMLVLQNAPVLKAETLIDGMQVATVEPGQAHAKLDLIITFEEDEGQLKGMIDYDRRLFAQDSVAGMASGIRAALAQMSDDPTVSVQLWPAQPEAENAYPLMLESEANKQAILHHMVEAQAVQSPLRVATVFEGRQTTYRDLNEAANRLAQCLRHEHGIGRGDVVALMMARSDRTVEFELAILKAGAAFLPIDSSYPKDRLAVIFEDSDPALILLEDENLGSQIPQCSAPVIVLGKIDVRKYARNNPESVNTPDDPAYVVYTSGSTGRPKGVVVQHRNIASVLAVKDWLFDFVETDVWSAFHSISFDFSVWEFYLPLTRGASVVVVPGETARNAAEMARLLTAQRVTVLCQVPSAFDGLSRILLEGGVDRDLALRWVIFGGEPIKLSAIRPVALRYPRIRFVNGYGVSETTILSSFKEIDPQADQAMQNIGRPISNQRILLCDENMQPVADRATGEMCIEGPAVTSGYLNQPELTAKSFVNGADGLRYYRSGDLARRLDNGDLIFVGRRDNQVKVRGYRVELDEVRYGLMELDGVRDAAVITEDDGAGLIRLVAFVDSQQRLDGAWLRDSARRVLPEYMVPSQMVLVDQLPLDANGKIDRRALHGLRGTSAVTDDDASPSEAQLIGIVEDVLGVRGVRAEDDFFSIGGHSLSAVQLVSKVEQVCAARLSLNDVFEAQSLSALAAIIDMQTTLTTKTSALVEMPIADDYALSDVQTALWMQEQFRDPGAVLDALSIVGLGRDIDPEQGRAAMNDLAATFDILRTGFALCGDTPRQIIAPPAANAARFGFSDLSARADASAALQKLYDEEAHRPFDMERGPLFRLQVVRLPGSEHVALCKLHHIISDGSTLKILMNHWREMHDARCKGVTPAIETPRIQFRDFVQWQQDFLQSDVGEAQTSEWAKVLSGRMPGELASRWHRIKRDTADRRSLYAQWQTFRLGPEQTRAFEQLCNEGSATTFMGLNALLRGFLYLDAGLTDISIGSPFEHRFEPEIQSQPGPFFNVLPIRTLITPDQNFFDVLETLRLAALNAFAKPLIPLGRIADRLNDGHPDGLMDVGFTLQTQMDDAVTPDIAVSKPQRIFGLELPMWFDASEENGGITITLAYNEALFTAPMIESVIAAFLDLCNRMIARPRDPLRTLVETNSGSPHQPIPRIDLDL